MLIHTKHSQKIREKIFFFSGFDDEFRENVRTLSDGKNYLLVEDELFNEHGELQTTLTKQFQEGYYLGHGCLGNGTTYWNKKKMEHGDYKTIGLIGDNGILNLYTKDKILIMFLQEEKNGGMENEAA